MSVERYVPIHYDDYALTSARWRYKNALWPKTWTGDRYRYFSDDLDETIRQMDKEFNDWRLTSPRQRLDKLWPYYKYSGKWSDSLTRYDNEFLRVEVDELNRHTLKMRLDVHLFDPEDVTVTVKDRVLQVHAKHYETSSTGSNTREYARKYLLPNEINENQIRANLDAYGVLTVEAPVPAYAVRYNKNLIPVYKNKSITFTPKSERKQTQFKSITGA